MQHNALEYVDEGDRLILQHTGHEPVVYEVVDTDRSLGDGVLCTKESSPVPDDKEYLVEPVDVEMADRVTVDTRDDFDDDLSGAANVGVRLGFEEAVGGEMDERIIETLKSEFDTVGDLDIYHL